MTPGSSWLNKRDQKFEEAAECRMYDEMTSNQINNAGSTDAFPIAQTWAIDFVQKRAKELGGDEWLDGPRGY